jgi:hypothetical protein
MECALKNSHEMWRFGFEVWFRFWFCFVRFRFVKFRFFSIGFVSFRLISFRFELYMYPSLKRSTLPNERWRNAFWTVKERCVNGERTMNGMWTPCERWTKNDLFTQNVSDFSFIWFISYWGKRNDIILQLWIYIK